MRRDAAGWVGPPISIWLVFAIWDLAAQTKTLMQVGKQLFTAALFYGLLWVGQYTQYVADLFLQTIPNTISAALGGNGTPIAQIDQLLAQTVKQAAAVYRALPGYSFKVIALAPAENSRPHRCRPVSPPLRSPSQKAVGCGSPGRIKPR